MQKTCPRRRSQVSLSLINMGSKSYLGTSTHCVLVWFPEEKDEKKDLKKKLLKMEPVIRGEVGIASLSFAIPRQIYLIIAFAASPQGIEDMELEEDKKDLINREIRSFRETHKVGTVQNLLAKHFDAFLNFFFP